MNRFNAWFLAVGCVAIFCVSSAHGMKLEVEEGTIKGRVYDATSQSGISDLIVKLIPPKNERRPEKITTTDRNGEFRFSDLDRGKYLLEVYQGLTLLYRNVVDTRQNSVKVIALKRKQ